MFHSTTYKQRKSSSHHKKTYLTSSNNTDDISEGGGREEINSSFLAYIVIKIIHFRDFQHPESNRTEKSAKRTITNIPAKGFLRLPEHKLKPCAEKLK